MSEAPRRQEWWWLAYLLLLGLPFLLRLGAAPLFDVDEGAFAEASREMWVSGDLGHTTLNGADRFDKPVAVYWLQAAALALFGTHEWVVRLPSALCAWLLCVAVAQFGRSQWGALAGVWAAGLLATSAGWLLIGRASTADALLNLCLGLTAMDLCRHLQDGQRAPLRRAALWTGLGVLTKGPVALLIPGAAVFLWFLSTRRWTQARRTLGDGISWGVLVAVAAPWYLYAWGRHGQAFVDGFLVRHNLDRFSAAMEGHAGGVAYYALVLPLLWLPWSGLLLPVLIRWREQWAGCASRFLLLWASFVLLFFSLSGTKLPHYALYACVPLSLLMARQVVQAVPVLRAVIWSGLGLWIALLALLPWWVPQTCVHLNDPLYRALLCRAAAPNGHEIVAGLACLALLVAVLYPTRRFEGRALTAGAVTAVLCVAWIWPWVGDALQGPVRRAALASSQMPGAAVQWGVHWPSVAFYRGEVVPRREPQVGELAFAREDRLPPGRDLQVIYREGGVVLVRRLAAAGEVRP